MAWRHQFEARYRDDYKFVQMIGQKPLLVIMSCNLIGHPYITLKRRCISGRTFSQNDLKNVRCQNVIIVPALRPCLQFQLVDISNI